MTMICIRFLKFTTFFTPKLIKQYFSKDLNEVYNLMISSIPPEKFHQYQPTIQPYPFDPTHSKPSKTYSF